jgi:thiamine biosynthesis lipoprotein
MHNRLSRFLNGSELSLLNASPAPTVKVSPLMLIFVRAAISAAWRSRGLVDPTLIGALEQAGYELSMEGAESLPLRDALAAFSSDRRPASADRRASWRLIDYDVRGGTVSRPQGVRLDSGGIAKGLAADLIAAGWSSFPTFAVNCGGDIRIGGSAGLARQVLVDDPFGGAALHEFEIRDGAVATSGIGRRAWLDRDGCPAHHLLDPGSGEPAFTGIVQATALAPTAQLAEVLAKTALLRGPQAVATELPYGGCVVFEDGSLELVPTSHAPVTLTPPPEPQPA